MRRTASLVALAVLALAAALTWHSSHKARRDGARPGIKLVVFGPSSWDTFAPGASEATVDRVTLALDDRFRAEHPEVGTIVHDARGPISDGLARLRNAQVAGDPLDVVVCAANPVNTAYARLGLIKPVDDLVERIRTRFNAGAIENFSLDGHVWAVPVSAVNLTTFFYNRDLFDKAGLGPPRTYEEFRGDVPRLTALGIIPVVHQGKVAWMWTLYYASAVAQATDNHSQEFVADLLSGRQRFDGAMNVKALSLMRRWVDDGVLDRLSNELDENGMKSVFFSGKAAAYFGGTWDIPGVAANASFRWGVFPFPQYADAPGHPQAFGGVESGLCLSATTRHPELAEAYIEFAARDANVRELLAPLEPIATSHVGVAGTDDALARTLRAQLPAAKFLDWILPMELSETLQRETQAMMGSSRTPREVAAALQQRFDAFVKAGYVYGKATPQ